MLTTATKVVAGMLLAGPFMAGCTNSQGLGENSNPPRSPAVSSNSRADADARMAAWAATSDYPSDAKASNDLKAMALVDRASNTIRILNASDRAMHDARVWVNGSFVGRLDNLPPNGSATLQGSNFFDRTGSRLSEMSSTIKSVQLQVGNDVYNVMGPVFER
jgi:hypothetical protein